MRGNIGRIRARTAASVVLAALALLLSAPSSGAAPTVSRFSVTPSTTRAGGHPDLRISTVFEPPTSDVRSMLLHLPPGLTANPAAAPFCARASLTADLCPLRTKVGSVSLTGVALGFEADVARNIYNMRPRGAERLRLGVPLFGSLTRGGVSIVLIANLRPDDGLDFAVAGPPREIAGFPIQLKAVDVRLKGTLKRRVRHRTRKRAFLTNPRSCSPATTVLDILTYDEPPVTVSSTSSFTPSGC